MDLTFVRPKQNIDTLRTYHIIIDGKKCGKIKAGEKKTITVSNSPHEIYLEIDWCTSNTVTITDTTRTEIVFSCYNSYSGPRLHIPFIPALYLTSWRNKYLTLEEISP